MGHVVEECDALVVVRELLFVTPQRPDEETQDLE